MPATALTQRLQQEQLLLYEYQLGELIAVIHNRKMKVLYYVLVYYTILWLVILFLIIPLTYIVYLVLTHLYPDPSQVPAAWHGIYQLITSFWRDGWTSTINVLLTLINIWHVLWLYQGSPRARLLVGTEGLLLIKGKRKQALRWSEVQELHTHNGLVTSLVSQTGTKLSWSPLVLSSRKSSNALLIEQVSNALLPQLRERFAAGQRLFFGDIEVDQAGLHSQGHESVPWTRLVDARLKGDQLFLYYDGKWRLYPSDRRRVPAGQAHQEQREATAERLTWEKLITPFDRPNLPLLVRLIQEVLGQQEASQGSAIPREPEPEPAPQSGPDSVPVMALVSAEQTASRQPQQAAAARAWQQRNRRYIILLVVILFVLPVALTGALVGGLVLFQQHQEAVMRAQISVLAHRPYSTRVPGQHCASGPGRWLDDPPPSIFRCLAEGLEIIQPNTSYEAGTFFSFDPEDQGYRGLTGDVFPAHYQMQVNVTFVEDPADACASLWVHVQKDGGHQEFDVCADGSWLAGHCDTSCEHFTLLARGALSAPAPSTTISIEVWPDEQRLFVDSASVTTIFDSMYQRTDSLALLVYNGTPDSTQEVSAIFSDFSNIPLPSSSPAS